MSWQLTARTSDIALKSQWMDTAHSGASYQRKELMNWMPLVEPADAELLPEIGTLVARSRDLARNHGIASSSFQTLSDNIVGTGLRLATMPDYKALGKTQAWAQEWSRNTESLWKAYAESTCLDAAYRMNFSFMTAMGLRSVFVSGEVLVLPLWIEGDPKTPFATKFQM